MGKSVILRYLHNFFSLTSNKVLHIGQYTKGAKPINKARYVTTKDQNMTLRKAFCGKEIKYSSENFNIFSTNTATRGRSSRIQYFTIGLLLCIMPRTYRPISICYTY